MGWRRWYFAEVPPDTQVWLRRLATAVPPWSGRSRQPHIRNTKGFSEITSFLFS
jgi:hypothetical protein